ncbi:lipase member J isoform X2 [Agrilus planipennis]|uniref:Lipase n=1 Tax=Agrilus planipennis TaxID=224129 RepID=A0A1W4X714_AGRPL|nr:lipase member J isoform X2 [Agrilus planipennis]XP_018331830.1 lipase member J isoform X2 [Agrilus planipennis]
MYNDKFGCFLTFIISISSVGFSECTGRNNVCKGIKDYYTIETNGNCTFDPDVFLPMELLITSNGYPLEVYEPITRDGYILKLFRIPQKKPKRGTVYLSHPLNGMSNLWVDKKNHSLAFMLSNAGYDVWMGNYRGNYHSERHETLTVYDREFWKFSFHEMALYDLPTMLEFIREHTEGDRVYYIGHSLGTTTAFIYSSLLPEHAEDFVKVFVCMSPVAFLRHVPYIMRVVARYTNLFLEWGESLGITNMIWWNGFLHNLAKGFCLGPEPHIELCLFFLVVAIGNGPDFEELNPIWIPHTFTQNFAGFSFRSVAHYGQIAGSERFQFFDHGAEKNLNFYGSQRPPLYPLDKMTVPIYLVYGSRDNVATQWDAEEFYEAIPPRTRIYGKWKVNGFNHVDFMYGRNVGTRVYEPIVDFVNNIVRD